MKYYGQYRLHRVRDRARLQGRLDQAATSRRYAARRPLASDGEQTGDAFPRAEPDWTVELVDTGLDTMSGGRIKRLAPYLGDGAVHADLVRRRLGRRPGPAARVPRAPWPARTLTAVHPPARFGRLDAGRRPDRRLHGEAERSGRVDQRRLLRPRPGVFDYIDGDETQFEREPLERLAARRRADGVPARSLLAVHGHAARRSRT